MPTMFLFGLFREYVIKSKDYQAQWQILSDYVYLSYKTLWLRWSLPRTGHELMTIVIVQGRDRPPYHHHHNG